MTGHAAPCSYGGPTASEFPAISTLAMRFVRTTIVNPIVDFFATMISSPLAIRLKLLNVLNFWPSVEGFVSRRVPCFMLHYGRLGSDFLPPWRIRAPISRDR